MQDSRVLHHLLHLQNHLEHEAGAFCRLREVGVFEDALGKGLGGFLDLLMRATLLRKWNRLLATPIILT